MRLLKPDFDLDTFFGQLQYAEQRALLLDYDGTLAPFRVERDQATPYPGIRELLRVILAAGHTRLVLVSGRWPRDLIPLLGLDQLPEIWGSHGWERLLPNGLEHSMELDEQVTTGLSQAYQWAASLGLVERYEQKPASLALHWRGLAPDEIDIIRKHVLEHWLPLAREFKLEPHAFDGGIELRVPGRDKGFAVRTILSEMSTDAVVAYLGDDLTDEDAFKAIKAHGLGVLVRSELRATAADLWIQPPDELRSFLERWHQVSSTL